MGSLSLFFIIEKDARRYTDRINDLIPGSATRILGSGFGAAKSKQSQQAGILR